jgi:hypothetical protein
MVPEEEGTKGAEYVVGPPSNGAWKATVVAVAGSTIPFF